MIVSQLKLQSEQKLQHTNYVLVNRLYNWQASVQIPNQVLYPKKSNSSQRMLGQVNLEKVPLKII